MTCAGKVHGVVPTLLTEFGDHQRKTFETDSLAWTVVHRDDKHSACHVDIVS